MIPSPIYLINNSRRTGPAPAAGPGRLALLSRTNVVFTDVVFTDAMFTDDLFTDEACTDTTRVPMMRVPMRGPRASHRAKSEMPEFARTCRTIQALSLARPPALSSIARSRKRSVVIPLATLRVQWNCG
jgi:hypothetical protein